MGYIFIFVVQYQLWKILKINNKQKTNVISLCKCFNMEINYLVLNQILNKDIQHKNRLNIENIQKIRDLDLNVYGVILIKKGQKDWLIGKIEN